MLSRNQQKSDSIKTDKKRKQNLLMVFWIDDLCLLSFAWNYCWENSSLHFIKYEKRITYIVTLTNTSLLNYAENNLGFTA